MGCIYQRKDNGRWRLIIRHKPLPLMSFHFDSYEEAKDMDDEINAIIRAKKVEAFKETLRQLGEQKLEISMKEALSFSKSGMGLVEFLEYNSYCQHREKHPDVKPEKWVLIFKDHARFEKLYQKEKTKK